MRQLVNLFGVDAERTSADFDNVWNDNYIVSGNPEISQPHQNNGQTLLRKSYINNKLFLGVTETSSINGGYMEVAERAAKMAADILISKIAYR